MRPLWASLIWFCIVTTIPLSGCGAQNSPSKQQAATFAQLDQFYAQKNWNRLGAALYPGPDRTAYAMSFKWLQKNVDNGGNFFMAMLLARDYWDLSNATIVPEMNVDDVDRDPRMTAGMLSLYAYALIEIDGAECGDGTSVNHRMDQLLQARSDTLQYLASRPPAVKDRMADIAVWLERRTGPLRRHQDELLCGSGMAMFTAGGHQQEVPTPSGHFGKTILVSPPPGWKPPFLSPDVYTPKQQLLRASLKDAMSKLLNASGGNYEINLGPNTGFPTK
jgi:hypothetical protein